MKNLIKFSFLIFLSFMFSCEKENIDNLDLKIDDITLEDRERGCPYDMNNTSISWEWNVFCQPSVTLTFCCICEGEETCTTEGGKLTYQAETCPFTIITVDVNIPSLVIPSGECVEYTHNIEFTPCETFVPFVSLGFEYNGSTFTFENSTGNVFCDN